MSGVPHQPLPAVEDVRAELTAAAVLQRTSIEIRQPPHGDWFGHQCPREFHRKSPRAFCINPETGRWKCYAGCVGPDNRPLAGDLFKLIAEHNGLATTGADFARVLAIAAGIAGVTAVSIPPEERERRRRERAAQDAQRRREREAARARHLAESIVVATAHWQTLAPRHGPAEQWLAERGVAQAVELGLVRFDQHDHGSIAMPLYTDDGQICNVIRRRLPPFAPTADDRFRALVVPDGRSWRGLWGEGTYVNPVADIERGRDVVIAEGFFDAITAAVAWRATGGHAAAIAIGARSASDLGVVSRAAAPRVKELGARLVVVPHRDNAGFQGAMAACREALDAGLRLGRGSLVVVDCGESDLNAAWCAGWRPSPRESK